MALEPPDLSGTPYRILERTHEGEFGAWRAEDRDGNRYVVKPTWSEDGVVATELLHAEGYPVARYVLLRPGLSVQEELPGAPPAGWDSLREPIAARAIALNEQLAGKRVPNAPPWPDRIYSDVLHGHFYVDLAVLKLHSEELLRRCQAAVRRAEGQLTDPGDLVHWDYTTANILARGDEITGVVDWDGVLQRRPPVRPRDALLLHANAVLARLRRGAATSGCARRLSRGDGRAPGRVLAQVSFA